MMRLENVLKVSLQDVMKTVWRRLEDVLARCLEDVWKTSWRHLQNVLKMSWRRFWNMSWRRLEDVWPRQIYWPWSRRLKDVLKTSSEDVWLRRIYSSWSRRLEDVLKTSCENEDEKRLQEVFKTSSSRRMFAGLSSCQNGFEKCTTKTELNNGKNYIKKLYTRS